MQEGYSTDNPNSILNEVFDFAKMLAKEFYFDHWGKNPPRSPAFDGEIVYITRAGWEHIAEDPKKSKMDKLGRFFSLERAKTLLNTAANFQDYRKDPDGKTEYWGFSAVVESVKIRVIVRSVRRGPKHFYSVIRKGTVEEGK